MHVAEGKSLWARRRHAKAAKLQPLFMAGSSEAALRLLQRRFALAWVKKYGSANIPRMVAASKAARERRKQQQEQQHCADQRKDQRDREALYAKMAAWAAEPMPAKVTAARKRTVADMERRGVIVRPAK
jgi:hypothetical protein